MTKTPVPGPIILDLVSPVLNAEEKEILQHPHVGGVIFFSRHFESPQQMHSLAEQLKKFRAELLLCVDQEGGRVQRFQKGFTRLPALKLLGDLWDAGAATEEEILQLSHQLGQLMALEMRSVGMDLSFAPVVDLGRGISTVIQDRAFHSHPEKVARWSTAYMKGMAEWGMSATAKHFPGHGSIALDSHIGLPEDHRSMDELGEDLYPFEYLIKQQLPAVMTAHIVYPNIDPDPVSFSAFWLKTHLRQHLGFKGTIVSDDLSMGGAVGLGNYAQRANRAMDAGCDYVLICNHREGAIQAIDGLTQQNDPHSAQRRAQLLAHKPVPHWQDLPEDTRWLQLQAALKKASARHEALDLTERGMV